jgi:hypothetical protein
VQKQIHLFQQARKQNDKYSRLCAGAIKEENVFFLKDNEMVLTNK